MLLLRLLSPNFTWTFFWSSSSIWKRWNSRKNYFRVTCYLANVRTNDPLISIIKMIFAYSVTKLWFWNSFIRLMKGFAHKRVIKNFVKIIKGVKKFLRFCDVIVDRTKFLIDVIICETYIYGFPNKNIKGASINLSDLNSSKSSVCVSFARFSQKI